MTGSGWLILSVKSPDTFAEEPVAVPLIDMVAPINGSLVFLSRMLPLMICPNEKKVMN